MYFREWKISQHRDYSYEQSFIVNVCDWLVSCLHKCFPGGSDSKDSAWNAGDPASIPGLGTSTGEGNATPLAWEIPWTEKCGGLQSVGSQRVRYDWVTIFTSVFLQARHVVTNFILTKIQWEGLSSWISLTDEEIKTRKCQGLNWNPNQSLPLKASAPSPPAPRTEGKGVESTLVSFWLLLQV